MLAHVVPSVWGQFMQYSCICCIDLGLFFICCYYYYWRGSARCARLPPRRLGSFHAAQFPLTLTK